MDLAELTTAPSHLRQRPGLGEAPHAQDLAVSVAIEAAELLELVQWKTDEELAAFLQTDEGRAALSDELADVLIYLVRLADITGVDLRVAADEKIGRNAVRFPPAGPETKPQPT